MAHNGTLNIESIVVAASGSLSAELGGEAVILNVESGTYFGLDEIGSRIWQLIQEPTGIARVCRSLREEYEVEYDQCAADVLALLVEMQQQGLIRVEEPSGA